MRAITWVAAIIVTSLGLPMHAADAYTILAPDSVVAGKSIADWTTNWWIWALQAPASANPLTDPTGEFANVNNTGPVFFIAGTLGTSGPATRTFAVPAGRPILLPMVNFFDTEPAEIDPPTATLGDREAAARIVVGDWLKAVNTGSLFASVDGNAVINPSQFLEVTDLFTMGPAQPGSLIASLGVPDFAELFPTQSAGYWLMIDGLAPGTHTLHFGGSSNAFTPDPNCCTTTEVPGFSTDVTDTISVIPEPASSVSVLTGIVGLLALHRARRFNRPDC